MYILCSTLVDDKLSAGNVNPTMTDANLAVENVNLVGNLSVVDENNDSSAEPAYDNLHYFESQSLMKENPAQQYEEIKPDESDVDTTARDYQSLSMTTMDYVSVYSAPGKGREGDIVPKIEVDGKFYAVVNKDKTEQHVYTSLAK